MNETLSEVEVKFHIDDLKVIEAKLQSIGATLTKERVYERNIRYENADKTLTAQGIVVRLRQDTTTRLTYKEPPATLPDNFQLSHRYEAEVEVSDFATMQTILGKLGYYHHMMYEKYRTTYTFESVEIVLDEMPYGNFIEIEGTDKTIEAAIIALGLESSDRIVTNYIYLFEVIKQALKLDVHDLSFANFEGVTVPKQLFTLIASSKSW